VCGGRILAALALSALVGVGNPRADGAVKFFDGFGDADVDNNGVPLEREDTDVDGGIAGDDEDFYVPNSFAAQDPPPFTNPEVTSVLDSSDVGLRWLQIRGFTGANSGESKPTARIVDDTQGAMYETTSTTSGGLGVTAINTGYALSLNSRGRGSSTAAFFDERVELGPEVGDKVKVSFDFRVWRDAPNANAVLAPEDAEIRFGLLQDTDNQLGSSNAVAGRSVDTNGDGFADDVAATWGIEEGWFEGGAYTPSKATSEVGVPGDAAWFGGMIIEDPAGQFPPITPNGGGWRIREETNLLGTGGHRIFQGASEDSGGDVDTVAVPQESSEGAGDFGLVNLNVNKVYNLSLTLMRDTDVTPGDTITATLTAIDKATGTEYSLSGKEPAMREVNGEMVPDGIYSDSWDYFAIRNTGIDDFDLLIDNFMLEIIGSNEPSTGPDYDNDGDVDGFDFLAAQRTGDPAAISAWEAQFGTTSGGPAIGAVPEPGSIGLGLLFLVGFACRRSR
jgi:hypothetical protein